MCIHTHTHVHTHARANTHTRAHTHTCVHTHAHVRACTHAHTCTHTCAHMHTYAHTHAHTRACTRTHTHTHTHRRARTHKRAHLLLDPPWKGPLSLLGAGTLEDGPPHALLGGFLPMETHVLGVLYPQSPFGPLGSSSSSRGARLTFPGRLPRPGRPLLQRRLPHAGLQDSVWLWLSVPSAAAVATALEPGSTWAQTRHGKTPPSRPF